MTNEELKRDAARYWRLRVLGCAPCETKQLESGTVLRFSNLDEFIDHDIKIRPSRGEAEIYENKTEGAAVSASPQPNDHELGDPLWPIYQKYAEEAPKPLLTYSGWLRTIAQKLEREFFAAAPAQEPPPDLLVQDLAMLVRRLLRKHPNLELVAQAKDFLMRKGLQGSILRTAAQEQPVENSPQKYFCSNCVQYLTEIEAMDTHDQSHDIVRVYHHPSPQKGKP